MSAIEAYKNVEKSGKFEFKAENHLRFVKRIAYSFKDKVPRSLCVDDLIQVGLITLLELNEKYDHSLGVSFEHFASRRVKGAMIDLIRNNSPISKEKMALIKSANNYIDEYVISNGYRPKTSVVAKYLNITLEKYQSLSLEYESVYHTDINETTVFDPTAFLPEIQIDQETTKQLLIDALKNLNDREQKMVFLYFTEELTHAEIAYVLSVSESRVSQMMKTTLTKLRVMLKESYELLME